MFKNYCVIYLYQTVAIYILRCLLSLSTYQFEQGHPSAPTASDFSDKSKGKLGQKVSDHYTLNARVM